MALTISDLEYLRNEPDRIKRRIACIAALSRDIEGIKPIIAGGCALEFYTGGGYATGDIDLLYPWRERLGAELESAGFQKRGRHWIHIDLDLHIEILATTIEQRGQDRLSKVLSQDNEVLLVGIEDLILDRLNGYVHAQSTDDYQWALELALLYSDQIDWSGLKVGAQEDATMDAFNKLKEEAEGA